MSIRVKQIFGWKISHSRLNQQYDPAESKQTLIPPFTCSLYLHILAFAFLSTHGSSDAVPYSTPSMTGPPTCSPFRKTPHRSTSARNLALLCYVPLLHGRIVVHTKSSNKFYLCVPSLYIHIQTNTYIHCVYESIYL